TREVDAKGGHADLHATIGARAAPDVLLEQEVGVVRIFEAENFHRVREKDGRRKWESNPPGKAWRRQPGLKPGRPTGDEFLPGSRRGLRTREHPRVGPRQVLVADPPQHADAVEELEDLDRTLAPEAGRIAKGRRGDPAVALGEPPGKPGKLL